MSIKSLEFETYDYTSFFYYLTHPKVVSDAIINAIYDRATNNLLATKRETEHGRPEVRTIANPRFTLETIDLSELRESLSPIRPDLHCVENLIFCRDSQYIFTINQFDQSHPIRTSIPDAHAVHIQNGMACTVCQKVINIWDIRTDKLISTLEGPDQQMLMTLNNCDFDIQLNDSYLSIFYQRNTNEKSCMIAWNYRTKNRLLQTQINTRTHSFVRSHLNDHALYTADPNYGICNTRIEKWDLNHPDNAPQNTEITEPVYSLTTLKDYLCVGNYPHLSIYNASDLKFLHQIEYFETRSPPRITSLLPFGNSLLCNFQKSISFTGIGAVKITDDILESKAKSKMRTLLKGEEIPGISSKICVLNELGVGKLVVGTIDGNIHILDFLNT